MGEAGVGEAGVKESAAVGTSAKARNSTNDWDSRPVWICLRPERTTGSIARASRVLHQSLPNRAPRATVWEEIQPLVAGGITGASE